jgi:AhpD family alkylhydroperoxidase
MARVKQVPEGEAKGKVKDLYDGIRNTFGKVPNTFQAMATNPGFLESMLRLNAAAGKALDPKTKELIRIAVSAVNNCDYCLDAHFVLAKKVGCTDNEIAGAIETAVSMAAFNVFNHGAGCEKDIHAE